MCISPLTVKNNSSYLDSNHCNHHHDVPCGHCLECRSLIRSEWMTRLSFEVKSLYSRGGVAVLLTFSYSDDKLPIYRDGNFSVPAFYHDDVLRFLNRLKVEAHKNFGKGSYKYFFVSEYGKNTRRPHYHGEFFLQPGVDWKMFTELCRKIWSSVYKYGYMFPKFDPVYGYIDDNYNAALPLLRNLKDSASYVSKYVTKDMGFYGLPEIDEYIKDKRNKERMKRYLPKHWQSNFLGYSVLDEVNWFDDSDVKHALEYGITNPLTHKVVPLPRYAINKMIYRNQRTTELPEVRLSSTTCKPLYDRVLTHFGRLYFSYLFDVKVRKHSRKMYETFQKMRDIDSSEFSRINTNFNRIGLDVNYEPSFVPLAYYHLVYNHLSDSSLEYLLSCSGGSFSELFTDHSLVSRYYCEMHDTKYMREHGDRVCDFSHILESSLFSDYKIVHQSYCDFSCRLAKERLEEFERKQEQLSRVRYLYNSKYDKHYV